jgi:hypothetical protein
MFVPAHQTSLLLFSQEPLPDLSLATRLVETLAHGLPGLFNPWRDHCQYESACDGPEARIIRLARHLDCDPLFILAGEAPGYQGCHFSGVAFTSERLLLEGAIPRIPAPTNRLSTRHRAFSEPSATIVWQNLKRLGIADRTILWNAVQLHPHKPGNVLSNRTPTPAELAHGVAALRILLETFPTSKLVAVGKKAERLLTEMKVKVSGSVRHPANGGATKFARELEALISI